MIKNRGKGTLEEEKEKPKKRKKERKKEKEKERMIVRKEEKKHDIVEKVYLSYLSRAA